MSAVSVWGACAPQQGAQAPTATTTDETVSYTIPNVTAAVTGTETQEKKSVIMAVVPMPFTVADTPKKECVPGADDKSGSLLGGLISVNNGQVAKKPYVVTSQTGVDFTPKTLTFQIKVTNHSDKVMKLEGAYLKLNINSEDVVLSDSDTQKFHAGILLPNDSHSFTIAGPDWGHNPDEAIITFQAITVPDDFDKAGAVSDTANFSWTFKAKLETKQAQSKKTVENLMLDPAEAANLHCHPGAVAAN
ncbi:MAG TPA: hypothetical protein VNW92_17040 [Polyangiaceae bacterium]|nr:hypothetical protein [Polyangiaceae bacterium]